MAIGNIFLVFDSFQRRTRQYLPHSAVATGRIPGHIRISGGFPSKSRFPASGIKQEACYADAERHI